MKTGNINLANWEATAADRSSWRLAVKAGIQTSELKREEQREEKRQRRRQRAASGSTEPGAVYTCSNCNKALAVQSQQALQLKHGLIHGAYSIVSRDRRVPTNRDKFLFGYLELFKIFRKFQFRHIKL